MNFVLGINTVQIWKVRKEGYEDAAKQFETSPDESAPVFRPFLQDASLMKGAVADSNVAAQQEGLAALCAFLKYGGKEHATRWAKTFETFRQGKQN